MSNIDSLRNHFKIAPHADKGDRFQAYCPAHEDKNASLSVKLTAEKALLFCHAGCKVDAILKAAGLTYADLFNNGHTPTNIYQYRNLDGSLSHEKLKFKTPNGKTFTQRRIDELGNIIENLEGVQKIPYNFPEVTKAIAQGAPILYCEGEKDADTARLLGFTATTMGGASDWKDEYKNYFKNACIVQFPDKDDAGLKLAHNVTESLKTVAKSLKVVIVPVGKDFTEWVEAGNKDVKELADGATDIVAENWLDNMTQSKTNNGYSFKLPFLNLEILIERLSNDLDGIIKILDNKRLIHTSKINLLSSRSLNELANRINHQKKLEIPKWNDILSAIANQCAAITSDGGVTEDISIEPKTMQVEYLLDPILAVNEPTTIFTAGGRGKSIFADYIAVLVQYGYADKHGLPFVPSQSNVLYLDWEGDGETHRRYINAILRGLEIEERIPIAYRNVEYPLAQVVEAVRDEMQRLSIGLVIIDSQMAATASGTRGMTEAQVASEYYNILRSLHCTTLTIDHVTKDGMTNVNGVTEAPFGSIVKYNRSRSQFELKMDDEFEDSDHKEYSLIHRKFNLGRRLKPIGMALDFENDGNELVSIKYQPCDLTENPVLQKTLTRRDRMIAYLRKHGKATIGDIVKGIEEKEENTKRISSQLANDKKTFVGLGSGLYGLLDNYH